MPARHDLKKKHHGRRKRGQKWRKRMWNFHHNMKHRKATKRRGRRSTVKYLQR